jgi:hypothetical protein
MTVFPKCQPVIAGHREAIKRQANSGVGSVIPKPQLARRAIDHPPSRTARCFANRRMMV